MLFRVLLKATDNIPSERVQVLQETVASYHGVPSSEITREMIEEASEVDSRYWIQGFSQSRKAPCFHLKSFDVVKRMFKSFDIIMVNLPITLTLAKPLHRIPSVY